MSNHQTEIPNFLDRTKRELKEEFSKIGFEEIPIGKIKVIWTEAQRIINDVRVKELINNFVPSAFAALIVHKVGNGYHCTDGQHRLAAAQFLFGSHWRVPCTVNPKGTKQVVAETFGIVNNKRTAPSAIERFQVQVTAKGEPESSIQTILTELGIEVGSTSKKNQIRCPGALINMHKRADTNGFGGAILTRRTVALLGGLWGKNAASYESSLLTGMSLFIEEHASVFDEARLRGSLRAQWNPSSLLMAAKKLQAVTEVGSTAANVVAIIVRTYNKGYRGRKLLVKVIE